MSLDTRPVTLQKYVYPSQVVEANPDYDIKGTKSGSYTIINQIAQSSGQNNNIFTVQIDLDLDKDKSENPPYYFHIAILGSFLVNIKKGTEDEMKSLALAYGSQLLIGALRERLAMLTSSAPWGVFYQNLVLLPSSKILQKPLPRKKVRRPIMKAAVKKSANKKPSSKK